MPHLPAVPRAFGHWLPKATAFAVVGLATIAANASAQLPPLDEYAVRVFGPSEGLPATQVVGLARDRRGMLFVATARGLVTYTGRGFRPVPMGPLEGRVILDMIPSLEGDVLWILTRTGMIARLSGDDVRVLATLENDPYRLTFTADGRLWASGFRGLAQVDSLAPNGARPVEELGDEAVAGVFDYSGDVLVMTTGGFFRAEPTVPSRPPRLQRLGDPILPISLVTVWGDDEGIWIPGDNQLHRWRPGEVESFGPGDPPFERMARPGTMLQKTVDTENGDRWRVFVSPSAASTLVREKSGSSRVLDLSGEVDFRTIREVFPDREGSVWLGTDQGLIQLAPRPVLALGRPHGLTETFTTSVLQADDGTVWVGSWGGGLHRFQNGALTARLTTAAGLPDDRIRSLYEASDGSLWIGTARGLAVVQGEAPMSVVRGDEVWAFVELGGRMWIGSAAGLMVHEGGVQRPVRPDLFGARPVYSLLADRSGSLWIGTEHGLFRRSADGTFERFGPSTGLRGDWIASLHEDPDGAVWVGTYSSGLHRLGADGRFVAVTTEHGLHHDGVWEMLFDDAGGVWMSSDAGVFRLGHGRLHAVADSLALGLEPQAALEPVVFTEAAGLPSRESNRASPGGWRLRDGRLLFNNLQGVVVIDPTRVLASSRPPHTEVYAVAVDGRSVPIESDMTLPPGTRHLAVEFGALAFVAPEQNRYRVRLDGYEDEWRDNGTRDRVEYTRLPPGAYTLRVQAATPLGPWDETGAAWAFHVAPYPWQTVWFRVLALVAVGGALVAAHRLRVRHVVSMERMRARIASDLHDDVGSNLISIALLSEMLSSPQTADEALTERRLLRIRSAAEATIASLRDIVWLVDPQHDNLTDLVMRMRQTASDLLPAERAEVTAPHDVPSRTVGPTAMRNVLLVFKEAIQNAAKHGRGVVHVEIGVEDGDLLFQVSDQGPGFEPLDTGVGYGLRNMRERAIQLGGTLDIDSKPGATTTVRFRVPVT